MTTDSAGLTRGQPRGPYAKTSKRQREIIEAAIAVFAVNGYRKSSTRDVADRAGISEAGLRHHFPTKTDLLEAVLYHRDEEDTIETDLQSPNASGLDRIRAYVTQVRKNSRRRSEVEVYAVLSAEATAPDHPAHEYFRRRFDWVREVLESAFRDLDREGLLTPDLDPALISRQLVALTDGLQVQWLMDDGFEMGDVVEAAVDRLLTSPLRTS